mgnify:CR=1 FL=1|jgi:hypothetical protein
MKQSFVKQIGLLAFTLIFTLSLFSSCHRGTGCPGRITYIEQPSAIELDC